MGSDTLVSNYQNFLEEQRWLFINTDSRAKSFLAFGMLFILLIGIWFAINGNALLIGAVKSKKYSPVEIHKAYYELDSSAYSILLLGGSTTRELTSSNRAISDTLSRLCNRDVAFINAGSSSQSYIASRSIYDYFADKNLDLVIVGSNLFRYILPPKRMASQILYNRLSIPISMDIFIEEFKHSLNPPPISPLYTAAYLVQKKSNFSHVALGKKYSAVDRHEKGIGFNNQYRPPQKSIEKKENIARLFLISRYQDFYNSSEFAANRWNQFAKRALGDGTQFVFVDLPISPSFVQTESFFRERYNTILESHRQAGADVVHWETEELGLIEADFFDQQHLLASGRGKIEPELVELIQSKIPGCKQL